MNDATIASVCSARGPVFVGEPVPVAEPCGSADWVCVVATGDGAPAGTFKAGGARCWDVHAALTAQATRPPNRSAHHALLPLRLNRLCHMRTLADQQASRYHSHNGCIHAK